LVIFVNEDSNDNFNGPPNPKEIPVLVQETSYDLGLGNFANEDCKNKLMMENTLSREGGVKATTSYAQVLVWVVCLVFLP